MSNLLRLPRLDYRARLAGAGAAGLTRWERVGLAALLALLVLFGAATEKRSAFMQRRMGDLDVFLRTAWAVRTGEDIYQATDANGYHYHYPPLLAILLVPLADPPPGVDRAWTLPYATTVAVCYVLNVLCLVLAVHWLATALEATSADPAVRAQPVGCRRWWALRVWPVLICLPAIGHTLMRGQVGLLLLLLVAGVMVALVRGQRFRAGLWLAGAICLKVIPAFLLIYPLWRRDGRCLAGCAAGLAVGLGLIPAAVFGPARTVAYYQEWTQVLVRPALGAGDDQSRAKELIESTASDSQSFQAAIHNTLYPDRDTRPPHASTAVRLAHWLIGGLLTAITLLAARRRSGDAPATVMALGALALIMLLLSPVCHLHYFALSVPLVMGLLAALWERTGGPVIGLGLLLLATAHWVANTLPHLPGFTLARDGGLAMYAALGLWTVGVIRLASRRCEPPESIPRPTAPIAPARGQCA